jgi:hypothetical protein
MTENDEHGVPLCSGTVRDEDRGKGGADASRVRA